MEEMKNRFYLLLPMLFVMLLASCVSVPSATSDINIDKKQSKKKLLFSDWKYKGFGQSLPDWFEAAYNNEVRKVRKTDAVLAGKEIKILSAEGVNIDQADNILKIKCEELSSDFVFYDASWARIDAEHYVALAVLYK